MSTFYNKFKEEEKQKEMQQFKGENFNSNTQNMTQPIIIQNKNTFKNFIRFLASAFIFCIKGLFYVGITIFSSIGATVILNESLRNTFIEFIKAVI